MTAEGARRPEIDGLRAIAVLAVVLFHARVPGFDGGFVGVDVFFVISGFLITGLLVAEYDRNQTIALADFWSRRFRRILPTLIVTLIVTMIVGAVVLTPWERTDLFESARAAAASFANFHFWRLDGGYFTSTTAEQPLLHTWSLGVEEQFYLVWPIAILAALHWGRRRGATVLVAFVGIASFAVSCWLTATSRQAAFYLPHARVWELAVGAAVALAAPHPRPSRTSGVGGVIGVATIVASALLIREGTGFPAPIALAPVLATALVLAITNTDSRVGRLLSHRVLTNVGHWSYAWYLFHWPAIVLCRSVLGHTSPTWELLLCAATLVIAAGNWRFVETRFAAGSSIARWPRARTLIAGITASVIVATVAWVVAASGTSERVSADEVLATIAPTSVPDDSSGPTSTPPSESPISFDWSSHEGLDLLAESRVQVVWPCVNFSFNLPFDDDCAAVPAERSIVAIGDSHVGSIAPALARIALERGVGVRLAGQAQCAMADLDVFLDGDLYGGCRDWVSQVISDIVAHKESVDAVVWVVRSDYYFPGQSIAQRVTIGEASIGDDGVMKSASLAQELWAKGVRDVIERLARAGIPVVLVHNWPEFRQWPSDCLARHPADSCGIARADFETYRQPSFDAEERAIVGLDHVVTFDPLDDLCTNDLCPVADGSSVLYRDDNHLTTSGSLLLVASLRATLDTATGTP